MRQKSRRMIAAAVGALGVLCFPCAAGAQSPVAVGRVASVAVGAIHGSVQDEQGAPIAGAMVSALGSTTTFAVTDRGGRFELRTLSPGPYLVRAHLTGFLAPRGQIIQVLPSVRVLSSFSLRRVASSTATPPVLVPASIGTLAVESPAAAPETVQATDDAEPATDSTGSSESEVAWRLRHARRSILHEAMNRVLVEESPRGGGFSGAQNLFGVAVESSARAASSFFVDTPFVGQVNLLTTGSFDTPQQLFTTRFARHVANMSVGAPVGEHADWTVRGAVTQGDISSWVVSGAYLTRASERHRYDIGLSYGTQRYDGGNPAALRNVTDGSRNAGTLHGFDTFAIVPGLSVTYGARYARYDYLENRGLLSPRVAVTVAPADHLRIHALVSRRALAPGAEEFVPPVDAGLWLPPQRTFSSLVDDRPLVSEQTSHFEGEVERDLAGSTTVTMRVFRQRVDGQLVTMFGVDVPGKPSAALGHYFVADGGGVDASGWGAGIRTVIAARVHGSVQYSFARARWSPAGDPGYLLLLAPSALRAESEQLHDLTTSIEAEVPETSTRLVVLYRLNNRFARHDRLDRPGVDARFDVQVRQSLPFMDFSSAKWEMLVAVRNFFRDAAADQSIYDELLVLHPPKRLVGGLTLRF